MNQVRLDFAASDRQAGFRLARLELFNWGTFHQRIWTLSATGENVLVTGDIGSGKSTLVDAVTTLLVPPQRIAYNKAAGADTRERSLRSYVLGYYKSERGDPGLAARPVMLRDRNSYSVILATFQNEGYSESVTLAQVFWLRDLEGQPARLYLVADGALTIAEHFAGFGTDLSDLRKRLRKQPRVEVHESFTSYGAAFRRRFGIDNEQALELFHQTVSMKSVGNLTDFVRQHMLEAFDVQGRIDALIGHFDDLHRAHEAVLKAKAQIAALQPLCADCDRHLELTQGAADLRGCREALRPYFAALKSELIDKRIGHLDAELVRIGERIAATTELRDRQRRDRDDLKRAIAENGGDRLERIAAELRRVEGERGAREKRAGQYNRLASALGLPVPQDSDGFAANAATAKTDEAATRDRRTDIQNTITEVAFQLRELRVLHTTVTDELASLRQRRSNIPAKMLAIRASLARELGIEEEDLPFAGELIQVQPDERDWEGAIERLLHGFGLSLLVGDAQYQKVAHWVDRTHIGDRLVYYRVRTRGAGEMPALHPQSLVHKLMIKPESQHYPWLEVELAHRFDYACCDSLDQFRRETRAVTRAGQVKAKGDRHEKDDRHRIDDRSRFVLGWSNEAKIAALEAEARAFETRIHGVASTLAGHQSAEKALEERLQNLARLAEYRTFQDLDWRPLVVQIHDLETERRALEAASDVLRTLQERLSAVETDLGATEAQLDQHKSAETESNLKRNQAKELRDACQAMIAATAAETQARTFPRLDEMRPKALGPHILSVESCDNREKDFRDYLQARIDAEDKALGRLAEKIVKAMEAYRKDHPLETQEADASVAAAPEYRKMLDRLASDDLPRFESRFKELLNENTIREVANFQSQLARERQTIKERIDLINRSLRDIEYNPGRYIVLEPNPTVDPDIRDFQQELRACTEGALTGSEDESYSEAKFLQVRAIIQRFRGREGSAELDQRWTRKVTDVRNWFAFSASERWREDDREHEHYTDSGGKSGGQKEKLAYTVLAASLVYQFGLESAEGRSRSFRFVVIDEAFGRGSDESARYGLELFRKLRLQLLIVTPLQKIHVIEPFVAAVGFVHTDGERLSLLSNLTIEEYRAQQAARTA
jgi:uncharacterized protein YPO0396